MNDSTTTEQTEQQTTVREYGVSSQAGLATFRTGWGW